MKLNYDSSEYTIENVVANLYNIIGNGVRIHFECEWKNEDYCEWKNGSYFKIKSITKNGRCYQAQRYHYKYIPLVKEATFEIYKTTGLYDYTNHKFHTFVKSEDMTMGKLLGRKLNLKTS